MDVLGAASATGWRRRVAWLACALAVASSLAVGQPSAEESAAAECTPVTISDFGSQPLVPSTSGPHCYLVTTENAGTYLVKAGDSSRPNVIGPGEKWVLPDDFTTLDAFTRYPLEADTTYRMETSEPSFAVYNPSRGDGCTPLSGTTWATTAEPVAVQDDEVQCRTFASEPGGVLRLGLTRASETTIFDGDGDFLCGGEADRTDDGVECVLNRGPGPYRVLVVNVRVGPTSPAAVSVVDTASSQGCVTVQVTPWGADLPSFARWATGRWQCFRIDPEVTGSHMLRFLALEPWAQYELWRVGTGEIENNTSDDPATANRVEDLEAGESYRYILKGNARPAEPGYRFGVLDLSNDEGCRSGLDLGWTAPSSDGQVPDGGMDCFAVTANVGDRYRLQLRTSVPGRSVSGSVTDASGASACVPAGGGGCLIQGPAPYRLLVGQSMATSDPKSLPYAVNLTDVSSPGCGTTELASWNAPLPLVAQDPDDGSAYTCYRVRTSAATAYRFTSWSEPSAGTRTYELWRAGDPQTGPGAGLVEPGRRMSLLPNTEYRLVVSGRGPDESAGEYRAGLFDLKGGAGCIRVTDVSWSAPAITGNVEKGELDCHEVLAGAGDRVRMEWAGNTELFNVDGSVCSRDVCGGGQPTRVRAVTGPGGNVASSYDFWLNELTDTAGCEARPAVTEPLALPMVAELGHLETKCFVIDPPTDEVQFWSDVEYGLQTPYLISPEGDDYYSCDLHVQGFCGRLYGPQTLVMRNLSDEPGRSAVLFRDGFGYPDACRPLTAAGFRGELQGIFDEECFSFALPEGTVYNMQAVGVTGSAQPDALVFGNGASCENFFCVAPGGTQTMRVINEGEGSGTYRVDLYGIHASFNLGPYLTGKPKVGARLRVVHGGTSPTGAKVSVRWLRDGKAFASGLTYRARNRDRGHVIRPRVSVSSPGFLTNTMTLKGLRIRRR